ncbi:hypothetical protein DMN91_000112 [Ooceraea biroi]|uniref:Uncharacterized protein n=1 Tax=Ooceraea biroi TaxID=2015173 RepID=A0A3L8E2U9_OOCBI|nr:hypothetical protein DMN91_000112 [Ooceraea biroi]
MAARDPEVGQQSLPMPKRASYPATRPITSARAVERKGKSIRSRKTSEAEAEVDVDTVCVSKIQYRPWKEVAFPVNSADKRCSTRKELDYDGFLNDAAELENSTVPTGIHFHSTQS